MRLAPALLIALLALLLPTACSSTGSSARASYDGPMPSASALQLLQNLRGATLEDRMGAFGGGTWEVGTFGVRSGPGGEPVPQVTLTSGGSSKRVPLLTDGDVNDLFKRIRGRDSSLGAGDLSPAYRAAVSGR